MGIDAQILIRKVSNPSEADLKKWSYLICESLGADEFFIDREKGIKAIDLTRDYEDEKLNGKIYRQDGPDILADQGETLLSVSVYSRYYGKKYERGDILFLCAVAEWCEQNIPGCEVWYGGDSSGVVAKPFTKQVREDLRSHLYSKAGREYFNYMSSRDKEYVIPNQNCKLCIEGKKPRRYGWGASYAAYYCAGCGAYFITRDGGQTWSFKKENL